MPVPPRIIRRLLITPIGFLAAVIVLLLSPLLYAAAAVVDVAQRRPWRAVRMTTVAVVFSFAESIGLLVALVLWIFSGFGAAIRTRPFQRAHFHLLKFWLRNVSAVILAMLGLTIDYERRDRGPRPVLIFSRHAGPGDSVFLTRTAVMDFDRIPRVVAKKELQLAPFFDVIGHRMNHHFVTTGSASRSRELAAIKELAAGLDGDGALVLFPEGGNFTLKRREKAISSLERHGHWDRAGRAAHMQNVIPPRPGGTTAALEGAPGADVIFVAHSGLEDLSSLADIWERMPLNRVVKARYWRVTPDDRPTGHQETVDWLFGWWQEIDQWIDANRPQGVEGPPT